MNMIDFFRQMLENPMLFVSNNADPWCHSCQRMDGCSQRHCHLCFHPGNWREKSHYHGGNFQFPRRVGDDNYQ